MNPFGTGAQARVVDKRDFPLGKIQAPVAIPEVYLPDISSLPTHHQHKLPTCGANAFAWFQENKFNGQFTPRYSWIKIKQIDGYPLEDGTDLRSIFKSGARDGVCDNSLLPDDSNLELAAYSDKSAVTHAMDDNAQPNIIQSYAFIDAPFSLDQIKQTIYNNKVVIALVGIDENWWTPSWEEKDILPLRPVQNFSYGHHFIVLYGYDKDYIYFKNSWGTDWGRGGVGYFGADYLPFVKELGTAVDADPEVIRAMLKKRAILTSLVSLWKQLKALLKL